ncbi:Acyl-CoA N-acyltransferase [Penicillium coprophilum]|uniref:Acyl-CoA N-acyltransferase n=1 Tax=Penicillium coprophilum TaxID=36646 RepID=UPI002394A2DD|nr:Acyl-CoA N-acyltransferase [Penicillium coprophilum]KAJ5164557.1 Acyl-CoA N-acyltransferase [Penicillium coprophilum]
MASISVFPFHVEGASNERVKLIPFNPEQHCETFFRLSSPHPEIYAHMPMCPPASATELKSLFYSDSPSHILSFSNPESFAFAIIDKTRPPSPEDSEGELAGTVSFIRTSPINLCAEIGFIVILPPYQRTHVATNAAGLALQLAFESAEKGGLGLRRVDWMASTMNLASARLAQRMGFEKIGVIPWHMRFVKGKTNGKVGHGKEPPPGSDPEDLWRDTVSLSLAWDQWENGAREMAAKVMGR